MKALFGLLKDYSKLLLISPQKWVPSSRTHKRGPAIARTHKRGSSNSSISVSLLPYRYHLNSGNLPIFMTLTWNSKGDEDYLTALWTSNPLQIPNNYINFLWWIREESARHSYITSQQRCHSHEPMTYYCNLFISCKIIEPKLNSYVWEISAKHRYTLLLPLPLTQD